MWDAMRMLENDLFPSIFDFHFARNDRFTHWMSQRVIVHRSRLLRRKERERKKKLMTTSRQESIEIAATEIDNNNSRHTVGRHRLSRKNVFVRVCQSRIRTNNSLESVCKENSLSCSVINQITYSLANVSVFVCAFDLSLTHRTAHCSRLSRSIVVVIVLPWNIRESDAVEMMDWISHCRETRAAATLMSLPFSNARNDEIIVCGLPLARRTQHGRNQFHIQIS